MAQTAGKVALADSFDLLTGTCPVSAHVIDFVGYGTRPTALKEGAARARAEQPGSCSGTATAPDTDENGPDFSVGVPTPRPRRRSSSCRPRSSLTDPTPMPRGIPRDATIEVSFTEPVNVAIRVVRHHLRRDRPAQ